MLRCFKGFKVCSGSNRVISCDVPAGKKQQFARAARENCPLIDKNNELPR
jgi:hypothetical protein